MGRIASGCNASECVYQINVEGEKSPVVTYYGQTICQFKRRWIEHRHAIENEGSPHATALSNYIHKLKKRKENFTIKCSIKSRASIYRSGGRRCMLCIKEKIAIALHNPKTLLNQKTEILHKCIHMTRHELKNHVKTRPESGKKVTEPP